MLYEWFKRAAMLERKNAVIDLLYHEIAVLVRAGKPPAEIAALIATDIRYDGLRRRFDTNFSWQLSDEDIRKSAEFVGRPGI